MSDNDAKEFINKVKTDPAIRDGLVNAVRDGAAQGVQKAGESMGLNFTAGELVHAYTEEMRASGLSDEDMKDLAGAGVGPHMMYGATNDGAYAAHPAYAGHPAYADHPAYGDGATESGKYADGSSKGYAEDPS